MSPTRLFATTVLVLAAASFALAESPQADTPQQLSRLAGWKGAAPTPRGASASW